jgi:DNA polymerase-1
MQPDPRKLVVIDGNNLVCRAYFAIQILTDNFNRPCNAVFGFAKMMLHVLETYLPSHVIIFFDSYSKRRKELFPDYKGNRNKEGLEDLYTQLPIAQEMATKLGFTTVRVEGYESDDLIYSVIQKAKQANMETLIYSNDKDMCQLVTNDGLIKILRATSKGEVIFGWNEVIEKFGVTPDLIPQYLALVGDASDNIPGVKGFGKKTVSKLLTNIKRPNYILRDSIPFLSTKMYEKLSNQIASYKISLQLADLSLGEIVPVPEINQLEFIKFADTAKDYVKELGFNSLVGRV